MNTILRVVDFETTGLAPPAVVIEVGTCDVTIGPDGNASVGQPAASLFGASRIPPETRAVHHISPAEVAGLPPFNPDTLVAQAVADGVHALVAHHADFEDKWLHQGSLPWICTYKCALRVWPQAPAHNNQCLRYWLQEQEGAVPMDDALATPAHRAGPDAYATAHLLRAILAKTPLLDAITWTREPKIMPKITIGKQRGALWKDVDAGFLSWMLRQADMDPDLLFNARRELQRRHG